MPRFHPPTGSLAMAAPRARFSLAASSVGKKRASEDVAPPSQAAKGPTISELSIEACLAPCSPPASLAVAAPRARCSMAAFTATKEQAADDGAPPNQQSKTSNPSELSVQAEPVCTTWRTSSASGRPHETEAGAPPGKPSSGTFDPLISQCAPRAIVSPHVGVEAGVDETTQVSKTCKFRLQPLAKSRNPPGVPNVKDLKSGPPAPLPPPQSVAHLLAAGDVFVGIDIETHELVPETPKSWREWSVRTQNHVQRYSVGHAANRRDCLGDRPLGRRPTRSQELHHSTC